MINPTDLVRGQKTRKEVEREEKKAELGVCRIRKLPKDGKRLLHGRFCKRNQKFTDRFGLVTRTSLVWLQLIEYSRTKISM